MNSLIADFDAAVDWHGPAHPKPSQPSLRRIEQHFGIELPPSLIELAKYSSCYSSVFASLGADYDSRSHIIRINSYWRRRRRTRRIPRGYIILTLGFDNEFWCLDATEPGRLSTQFWCPEPIHYFSDARPVTRYPSFDHYLRQDIYWRSQSKDQC